MTLSSFVKNMLFLDLEYKHPIRGRFTAQLPQKAMHIPLNISQIEINFSGKLFNILYIVFASPGSKVYFCEPAQGRRKIDNREFGNRQRRRWKTKSLIRVEYKSAHTLLDCNCLLKYQSFI